jgi:maltooligosyltrehalose trehalohydrolase
VSDLPRYGAFPTASGVRFRSWAPNARRLTLHLDGADALPMEPLGDGTFVLETGAARAGSRYRLAMDDGPPMPDPASRFQPEGVHGPSQVVAQDFDWTDDGWSGMAPSDLVFYELHVGTFTPEGTLAAATERLDYLRALGITAIELMPLADWHGRWGWGYDHAALFAVSRAYGTPDDLRRFVDRAHALGLAVYNDVIFNHLGPDGSYVAAFGPMFMSHHHTPWGSAINFDDQGAEHVRRLFLSNARMWLDEYRMDGLRLDATDQLKDDSDLHFLAELTAAVDALPGWKRVLIAEDHRNLNAVVQPRAEGGYGLDGVWADDFHHLIRNHIAGDEELYYAGYKGSTAEQIARTVETNWFYTGQHAPHWGRARGTEPAGQTPEHAVFCIQNHDQIGNRPLGNRLSSDASPAQFRAASALLLFCPQLPLVFQGQEWGANTPFLFFSDHEPELGRKVTAGRKAEFAGFAGFTAADVPDPQAESSFRVSKLDWDEPDEAPHAQTLALYRVLLALRRELPPGRARAQAYGESLLVVQRGDFLLACCLRGSGRIDLPEGFAEAEIEVDTESGRFGGSGAIRVDAGAVAFDGPGAVVLRAA